MPPAAAAAAPADKFTTDLAPPLCFPAPTRADPTSRSTSARSAGLGKNLWMVVARALDG